MVSIMNISGETVGTISRLMCEMDPSGFSGGMMTGVQPFTTINQLPFGNQQQNDNSEETDFSEQELRVAKKFVELIGCPERASELIDKISECEDCLGLVGDEDEDDMNFVASTIPRNADSGFKRETMNLPTMISSLM